MLVLLINLASFLRVALDLPEKSCPLGSERTLCIDIALVTLNLSAVDSDCLVEATLAAFEVGPGDDSFDVTRDCGVLMSILVTGNQRITHAVQGLPHEWPLTYQPFLVPPQNVHTATESPCGSWAQKSYSPSGTHS